ncbi:MAG: radical SAM protein [Candidatus Pacearchaeota archaeon]
MESPWLRFKFSNAFLKDIVILPFIICNKKFYILLNKTSGSWVVVNKKEISEFKNDKLPYTKIEFLFKRKIISKIDGDEVEYEFDKPQEFPNSIIMNVTTACNLKCEYCFADSGPEKKEYMTRKTAKKVVQELIKSPYSILSIDFQGGEPLLNKELIKFTVNYAKRICPRGKKFNFKIETNGTLIDDEIAEFIKKNNISVGVSIDGPKELHDKARKYPDGSGSFKDVWRGIKILKKHGIDLSNMGSVVVIGKHNVKYPDKIVKFFSKNKISFKPLPVNPLSRAKENKNIQISSEDWYRFFKKSYHLSKKLAAKNYLIHIYEENTLTPIRDYICLRSPCGMAHEIVSINPDGSVFPCNGFKSCKNFILGNILKKSLNEIIKSKKYKIIADRDFTKIPACKNCIFHSMCGPCAYASYGYFGSIFREDPMCFARKKIFQFIIKKWIESENEKGSLL